MIYYLLIWQAMQECISGPETPDPCAIVQRISEHDLDHDGDVDLFDFAIFQNEFTLR